VAHRESLKAVQITGGVGVERPPMPPVHPHRVRSDVRSDRRSRWLPSDQASNFFGESGHAGPRRATANRPSPGPHRLSTISVQVPERRRARCCLGFSATWAMSSRLCLALKDRTRSGS